VRKRKEEHLDDARGSGHGKKKKQLLVAVFVLFSCKRQKFFSLLLLDFKSLTSIVFLSRVDGKKR